MFNLNSFKIKYLDNISKYSGIFRYGSTTVCDNMKFYISLKVSSSRYLVCDFIDKQSDDKLVFRTLDHIYHKIKFNKIISGSFIDPLTNRRIDIVEFSKIMESLRDSDDYNSILYYDNVFADDNGLRDVSTFILCYVDKKDLSDDVGHCWESTFNVSEVPFSFYIDSLLSAYNQFLKK